MSESPAIGEATPEPELCTEHFSPRRDNENPPICKKAFAKGLYPCEFPASASPVETEATPAGEMSSERVADIVNAAKMAVEGTWRGRVNTKVIASRLDDLDALFASHERSSAEVRSLREALAAAQKEREAVIDVVERYSPTADEDLPAAVQLMSDIIAEREYDAKCWQERALRSESSARSLREERIAADERFRALKHAAIVFWGHPPFPLEDPKARALEDALAASLSPSPAS